MQTTTTNGEELHIRSSAVGFVWFFVRIYDFVDLSDLWHRNISHLRLQPALWCDDTGHIPGEINGNSQVADRLLTAYLCYFWQCVSHRRHIFSYRGCVSYTKKHNQGLYELHKDQGLHVCEPQKIHQGLCEPQKIHQGLCETHKFAKTRKKFNVFCFLLTWKV